MLAVRPCLSEFWEEAALPASVRGPVECFAFSRLAAAWAADDIVIVFLLHVYQGEGGEIMGCPGK